MKRIIALAFIINVGVLFSQPFLRDIFIGKYTCQRTAFFNNVPSPSASWTIHISKHPSDSNMIVLSDSTSFPYQLFLPMRLYSDSTFKDTIQCSSGACFFGNFHHLDSIYFYRWGMTMQNLYYVYRGKKTSSGVGVHEIELENTISLFPMPAFNKLHVNSQNSEILKYLFVSSDGKMLNVNQVEKNIFDVGTLPVGLYFIQLQFKEGILTKKIIISR